MQSLAAQHNGHPKGSNEIIVCTRGINYTLTLLTCSKQRLPLALSLNHERALRMWRSCDTTL
jgi:hypothetical protein